MPRIFPPTENYNEKVRWNNIVQMLKIIEAAWWVHGGPLYYFLYFVYG